MFAYIIKTVVPLNLYPYYHYYKSFWHMEMFPLVLLCLMKFSAEAQWKLSRFIMNIWFFYPYHNTFMSEI